MEACSDLDHYAVVPLVKAEYSLCNSDSVELAGHCIVEVHSMARLPGCKVDRLLLLDLATSDSAGLTRSSVDLGEVVASVADPLSLAHTKLPDSVRVYSDKPQMFEGDVVVEEVQGIVATVVDCSGPGSIGEVVRVELCGQMDGLMSSLRRTEKDGRLKASVATQYANVFALLEGSFPTMIGESPVDLRDTDCWRLTSLLVVSSDRECILRG